VDRVDGGLDLVGPGVVAVDAGFDDGLALVDEGGERASQLADLLAVAKPTITAVVDGLVERGLLERTSVQGDRRSIRLTLTKGGTQALRVIERRIP